MKNVVIVLFCSLLSYSGLVFAEQSSSFDDYVVHYNALTTDQILPAVARPYGILRSKNRALVNISVQKKVMGTPVHAVEAKITVIATNLNAQLKTVEMRQVSSGGDGDSKAIYYIGELPIDHKESLKFDVSITPSGTDLTHQFDFQQQFFTK